MYRRVVQISILAFTLATVYCETPKLEKRQGMAGYQYEYLPITHLDANMGLNNGFGYNTGDYESNGDNVSLGIILGSKTGANIGLNNINTNNKAVPVLVQHAVPFSMKRPIAIPVNVRLPVHRAVPMSLNYARPSNIIQNQRYAHSPIRKEVPRFAPTKIVPHLTPNFKYAPTYISKHRHPTNGKSAVLAIASPTINQESNPYQYTIVNEVNEASGLKYGSVQAYPESFNAAPSNDNMPQGYAIPYTNQDHSTAQYVPVNTKYQLANSKQSALNNREQLGLNHYSSLKDYASHVHPSVTYDSNSKTAESNGTPSTYVYYSGANVPFNYEVDGLNNGHTDYGNSAQNSKYQTYQPKYSAKYNIQEDAYDSNLITHTNFENYAPVPTSSSDETYDGGRTSVESNSDQNNYAYYTSAKSHGPDTIEPQASNSHLIGVSYGPSAKSSSW